MLALFASLDKRTGDVMGLGDLLKSMVPFYLGSLIEVSSHISPLFQETHPYTSVPKKTN
jgi:hypothetical protein